jgi:hypothetical protein
MKFIICICIGIFSLFSQSYGQYYKILYSTDSLSSIMNGIESNHFILNNSSANNYDMFDLDGKGISTIITRNRSDTILWGTILDGSTLKRRFDIKYHYDYNGTDLELLTFVGFYDIDGDNEREAIFYPTYPYGLVILNVRTQKIEYFGGRINVDYPPEFQDINNDGYIELVTQYFVLGHSSTNTVQQQPLAKSVNLSIKGYPNPFKDMIKIDFKVPVSSNVDISIYNAAGKLVRKFDQGIKPAGIYQVIWDGKSDNGVKLASGEYNYIVKAGNIQSIKQIIMLK